MDKYLIDLLASRDPRVPSLPSAFANYGQPMEVVEEAKARFSAHYSNPAFGWAISVAFADVRRPLPVHVNGRDHWLLRAYMFRLDSVRWRCKHVIDAWGLANLDEARNLKNKVCSLLLSGCGSPPDAHRRAVSELTDIPLPTLEAFDTLFYNVLDRHKEAAYLSEQIYPTTRLVELAEDYSKHADVGDVIKRAGYNQRDLGFSSFVAGLGDASYMAKLSARSDREQELTRHLMGNALLLVNTGALNQRSVGMARAQTLLAAQRQSGQQAELPIIADASDHCSDELRRALDLQDQQRVHLAREDAGNHVEE